MTKGPLLLLTILMALKMQAQESATDAEAELTENIAWYSSPWIWVVGAAIVIIVLVALSKDKKA